MVRALHAGRRDREQIAHATRDVRDAFIDLLDACPPWAREGSRAHAFGALQDQLDAGVAFGAVGHAVEPEVQLRRIAIGPCSQPTSDRGTPSEVVDVRLARFTAVYARPVGTVDAFHLVAPPRGVDLAELAAAVAGALGPWGRVRSDERAPAAAELAWLNPRPAFARARPSATLRGLAALAGRSGLDPLPVAAIAYARVLLARPFLHGNEIAGLVAVDMLLRATPGLSASRVGLGTAFRAHRNELRAALRAAQRAALGAVARDHGAWTTWIETFLRIVASAARATSARARAHATAHAAVRERLTGPDAHAALGRRRIDGRDLADVAARTPYLSIGAIGRAELARDRTAGRYLTALVRLGLGREERWGRMRLIRVSALADAVSPAAGRPRVGMPGSGVPAAVLRAAARRTPPIDPDDP